MAGLEGTVKTPLGPVQKKTALYIVFGVAVLGGIVYYRHKQTGGTVDSTATTDAEIDPATGYPYGSPEDAAALAAQGNYVSPPAGGTGGGGSSIPTGGIGYVSNGAWVQGVIEYMTSNGLVEDPTALSAALGKYITAGYVVPGSNEDSLITQAIAVQGYPPISGPSGMPPAINRNPPTTGGGTTTPSPTATNLPGPTGLKATRVDKNGVALDWNPVAGAIGYQTYVSGKQSGNTVLYSNAYVSGLKAGTRVTIGVFPVNSKMQRSSKWTDIVITTKK